MPPADSWLPATKQLRHLPSLVLLLLNLLFSAILTGLIWTVQLVHYPGFSLVGPAEARQYQLQHTRRIGWLVIPLMLAELALTCWLLFYAAVEQDFPALALHLIAGGCVLAIWLLTGLVFVKLHRQLDEQGYTPRLTRALVRWNWPRTLLWSLRTGLLLYLLSSELALA